MLFIFSFSEGTLIPTHQSGKALYYNSIKTELKSPQQKNDQTKSHQAKHQQPQPQGNHQEHHAKETKVVFSNGGVNTALHDSVEPTSTENGKILASKENGKVVENGNHDKANSESTQFTSERIDVGVNGESRGENGTALNFGKSSILTNGHSKGKSEPIDVMRNVKKEDLTNGHDEPQRRGSSSGFFSNSSSPTHEVTS